MISWGDITIEENKPTKLIEERKSIKADDFWGDIAIEEIESIKRDVFLGVILQ